MKIKSFFLVLLLAGMNVFAAPDPMVAVEHIQSELETALSRMLPAHSYLVQVHPTIETVSEKKLLEGESVTQRPESTVTTMPPLPGFTPPLNTTRTQPAGQTREIFKTVDKDVLKSLDVQVTFDQTLDQDLVNEAQSFVRSSLRGTFGDRAHVRFHAMKLNAPSAKRESKTPWPLNELAIWVLAGLLLVGAILAWVFRRRDSMKRVYPTVEPREEQVVSDADIKMQKMNQGVPALEHLGNQKSLAGPSAMTRGKFPALPATENFADRRYELLNCFLNNASTFRLYYSKLAEGAQLELYAGLRGPAFDSLLETLGIPAPQGADNIAAPTEEQMQFYAKNFNEFIQMNAWQNQQFFGFLQQLTNEMVVALIQQENPLVGALMLKFMKPAQSAAVLKALSSEKRIEILAHSTRASKMSIDELSSIEASVRSHVEKLPRFLLEHTQEDTKFWSQILTHADNQEQILMDLERVRPELYSSLAKFRFKLEDIPALPLPLLAQVVDGVDNDQLAMALLTCPRDVSDFVLNKMASSRRALVSSQLVMFTGVPEAQLTEARMTLTHRFREVMA